MISPAIETGLTIGGRPVSLSAILPSITTSGFNVDIRLHPLRADAGRLAERAQP
ncbi:MAG: hypothetical protein U0521_09860 [Anaerolineae bacterium]